MLMFSKERCTRFVSIAALVLLLHGCSNFSALSKHGEIAVDSEPSGASVYAIGKMLGSTPLVVRHQDVFPVVYEPDQEDLYGNLLLTRDGCQDYWQRVDSAALRKGVKVKLDCAEVAMEQAITRMPQGNQPGIHVPAPTSLKQRLIRLDQLHQEGLITDEEYVAARRRILDEL